MRKEEGGNVGWEYDEEEDKIFRESKAACAEKGKEKGFKKKKNKPKGKCLKKYKQEER